MNKCILFTNQPNNANNFNKSKFGLFKNTAIKLSSKPIQSYNNHSSFNNASPTKVSKEVSINHLPIIILGNKKPKLKKEQLNLKRKKYKKDSNSSLSNQLIPNMEKTSLQSNDSVTYETTTTVDERKKCSKITVFYQIEKGTLLIQRIFRGFLIRTKVKAIIKEQKKSQQSKQDYLNDNVIINNKQSKKLLLSLDQLNNSFTSVKSKVSNISINSNDLNFTDEEEEDYMNL